MKPSQNLLKDTRYKTKENRNRKFFKPSDTYNGLCVNNAIECIITQKGERIGSIHMPVHLYLNRYGNSAMNGWDGNSISVGDNDGKQLILAPQVGAGTKDDATNQFTGVFMGSVKEAGKDKEEHGLFGYSGGERTIALSSTDGSARFGRAGLGQIVIDPSTNQALITSGNYNEDEGKGMAINLSEPSIKFANGNFEVDKDGQIWATQYATKNMKFDSSSVNGLDDRLDDLDTTVEDLNATINYLDVVLPTNNITVETNTLRIPTHTDTKTIECLTTYKGTIIKPTVKIEGSHPGITNVSSSYDTERGLTILSFHVDSTQAISDATNNYNVTFSYNKEDCSPVTKIVSVLVIEKGKDGTSVNIKGTEKNIVDLCKNHSSGNTLGDGYVLEDDGNGETGHLFIFTNEGGGNGGLAADWKDVGRIQGTDGVNGRGVQSITYQYLTNNSSIKPSATDTQWKDIMSVPTEDKRFLWQKETITFVEVDGQLTEQDTVLLLAVYGESGNGITKTEVGYQIWTDGTTIPTGTWLPTPPETQAGDYLWTRIRMIYSSGDPVDSYSITYIGKDGIVGKDGKDGKDGAPGKDGKDAEPPVTIKETEGTVLQIEDGRTVKEFRVEGKSTQKTRSGYNLLPNNGISATIEGVTFTVNSDKSITMNGTAVNNANFPIFGKGWDITDEQITLATGTYFTIGTGTNNAIVYCRDAINNINVATQLNNVQVTNQLALITYAFIQVPSGKTVSNETIYPIIVKGEYTKNTFPKYEPYGESPSPDYPSEIKSVGYKNLFKPTLTADDGTTITVAFAEVKLEEDEFILTCKNGTDMYFGQVGKVDAAYNGSLGYLIDVSGMKEIYYKVTNDLFKKNFVSYYNENKTCLSIVQRSTSEGVINLLNAPTGTRYITFRFGVAVATIGTTYKTKVLLSEGNLSHPYIQFGKYGIENVNKGINISQDITKYT